jgi:hypothetical protein
MLKKAAITVFLGILQVSLLHAAMISVMVIETGLPFEAEKNVHSRLWENAFFEVLFDSGHIVCNSPIMRLEGKPSGDILKEASSEMRNAEKGGIDYFIIVHLEFPSNSAAPEEISLVLYQIRQNKIITNKNISVKKYNSQKDETIDLKTMVKELVPFIK